jgi:hypothetical protein
MSKIAGVTIHRVGPTREPHLQDLGRVLVTIDDLRALLDLLQSPASGLPNLQVEFNGGYFTDADDLRRLNDNEIRSLRIRTPLLEVVLDPFRAYAIGDDTAVKDVYRLWARARQLPSSKWNERSYLLIDRLLLVAALIGVAIVVLVTLNGASLIAIVSTASIAFVPAVVALVLSKFMPERESQVEIYPFSLHEHRTAQVSNKWPRAAVMVSIVSAGIAVLAIAAPIVFSLLSG